MPSYSDQDFSEVESYVSLFYNYPVIQSIKLYYDNSINSINSNTSNNNNDDEEEEESSSSIFGSMHKPVKNLFPIFINYVYECYIQIQKVKF